MIALENLARFVANANYLTDKGMLNLQKLIEALVFAVIRVESRSYLDERDSLDRIHEMLELLDDFPDKSLPPSLGELIRAALNHYKESTEGDLQYDQAPDVFVCRNCGFVSLHAPPEVCAECGEAQGVFRRFLAMFNGDNAEPDDPRELIDLLDNSAHLLKDLVANLPVSDLERHPIEGKWSLRDHIVHFHEAQTVLIGRVSRMLTEDAPDLASAKPYDIDTSEESGPAETKDILNSFLAERKIFTDQLRALGIRELWRRGQHEDFGLVSVMHQVKYFACHEQAHLGTIVALKNAVADDRSQ